MPSSEENRRDSIRSSGKLTKAMQPEESRSELTVGWKYHAM